MSYWGVKQRLGIANGYSFAAVNIDAWVPGRLAAVGKRECLLPVEALPGMKVVGCIAAAAAAAAACTLAMVAHMDPAEEGKCHPFSPAQF